MTQHDIKKRASRLAEDFMRLKSEISSIIEEGRQMSIGSETIVDEIMSRVVLDREIVIGESTIMERPVNMKELVFIARKAVEQAAFDGVSIVLPTGERIKNKKYSGIEC